MRLAFALLFLAAALVLAAPVSVAFPEAHSPVQKQWQSMFMLVFWIALAVGVVVEGLIVYAALRFRRRKTGPQAGPATHGNTRMEIAWTLAPALVMGWLLVVSYQGLSLTDRPPTMDFYVNVTGSQFFWTFEYPDGTTSTNGTLRVEVNKRVGLNVTSTDVIHAFAVPQLGVMIDAIPGRITHFWFQADAPGTYNAMCRELCNNEYRSGHGRMVAKVEVFPAGTQINPFSWPPAPVVAAPAGANATGQETPKDVSLSPPGQSFKIQPATFEFSKGEAVAFKVANDDPSIIHNFYVGIFSEPAANHGAEWFTPTLLKGGNATLIVNFPDKDVTYEIWCDVPGHRQSGMTGELKIGSGQALVEGPKPLLPGFELPLLLIGGTILVLVLRRRT